MLSCYLHVGAFGWLPPLVIVFLKLSVLFTAWKSSLVLYAALLALGEGEFSQEIRKERQFVTADVYYIGIIIAASLMFTRLLQQSRGFLAKKRGTHEFCRQGGKLLLGRTRVLPSESFY